MNTVAVTGSNGYIGSHLCRAFAARGWRVRELSRRSGQVEAAPTFFDLGCELAPGTLRDTDVLVHCAHDFRARGKTSHSLNVDGSRTLLERAKEDGVGKLIFISSMAAFDGCRSVYGQTKLTIEREVNRQGGVSIRPATVYGESLGGMIGSLDRLAAKLPVVPVVGGVERTIYLVHIDDLTELVVRCADSRVNVTGVISAASPRPVRLGRLLELLARRHGRSPRLVPVPGVVVRLPLKVLEMFRIRTPVRSDSIVSFLNQNPAPDLSLPPELAMTFREFEE
jgi:nucleoside-diphosphate-sugar epimerase